MSRSRVALLIIGGILIIDQLLKIYIKTNLMEGEDIHVFGNWFILHFTENKGMAFGLEFGGKTGKLILSLFRIAAIGAIGWYLSQLIKQKAAKGLIISISLILAGAIGNILDSAFYGMLFSHSHNQVAEFLPEGGGYASFLHGKVVDMLYFPIIKGYLPEFLGGKYFIFFRPVFNIADTAITTGVLMVLVFQKRYFNKDN
jgi:signal peptidase II